MAAVSTHKNEEEVGDFEGDGVLSIQGCPFFLSEPRATTSIVVSDMKTMPRHVPHDVMPLKVMRQ